MADVINYLQKLGMAVHDNKKPAGYSEQEESARERALCQLTECF